MIPQTPPALQISLFRAQSTHAPPPSPHAVAAVPGAQVVPLQHPPLQPVIPVPHVVLHRPVVGLHAWPAGQSVAKVHPVHVEVAPQYPSLHAL
jgi:hypothetical protein